MGKALGRQRRGSLGEFHGFVARHLEADAVVERCDLLLYGFDNFRVAMPGTACPEAREGVIQARTVAHRVPVAVGTRDDARFAVEVAIGRERQPVRMVDGSGHGMAPVR